MAQHKNQKIRSKKQKTRFWRHVVVFFICFLIACVTWLSVMYTKEEQNALQAGAETACAEALPLAPLANV